MYSKIGYYVVLSFIGIFAVQILTVIYNADIWMDDYYNECEKITNDVIKKCTPYFEFNHNISNDVDDDILRITPAPLQDNK